MIRVAIAVALLGAVVGAARAAPSFSADATVNQQFSPKRVVVVHVRAVPGASCTFADALTGLQFHVTTPNGRATWRWRPSVWVNGADAVDVRCTKGSFRRSATLPLVFLVLQQVHVLRHYAVHLVYWAPKNDMPADVAPAVLQLEQDVKAALDDGATDNPFAIPRGFGDSLGSGDPRIASIDATTAADAYPSKPAAGYCLFASGPCLGRPDLAREVTRLARQHRWAAGNRSLVMVFTAPSVAACFESGPCSSRTEPCGYHSLTSAGLAYVDVIMSGNGGSCRSATPAAYAIGLVGHEQNEAVVDPQGFGVEVADPCEGEFARILMNGHAYDLPAIEQPSTKCAFGYTP